MSLVRVLIVRTPLVHLVCERWYERNCNMSLHLNEFLIGHLVFVLFKEKYSAKSTNNQINTIYS